MEKQNHLFIWYSSKVKALEGLTDTGSFRIMQILTGHAIILVGTRFYFLRSGDVFFIRASELHFWNSSADTAIHYCAVSPEYLFKTPHVLRLFCDHPVFTDGPVAMTLSKPQRSAFTMLFQVIVEEETSTSEDKQEAILLYLQMMFFYINRVYAKPSNHTRLTQGFWLGDTIGELLAPLFDDSKIWLHN